MRHLRIRALATLLPCLLAACGGEMTEADAGPESDAGAADAGPADNDAGDLDAGPIGAGDAGPSNDAGPPSDAGLGQDASPDWPDAGLPPPEWVDLTVGPLGSCPDFTPCGGDIVGAWDFAGGCFEIDIESAIDRCPGAQVTRREGRGRGRVVFEAGGAAHRVAESIVEADTFFPSLCTQFFSCQMLENAMAPLVTEASCTSASNGDCTCTARQITSIDDRDTYSVDGNEIVGGFSGKRWAYCVSGDQLIYRDTDTSAAGEPGDIELARP